MTFSPRMTVAVRIMALNRADGWMDERRLVEIYGISTRTLRALRNLQVVEFRTTFTPARNCFGQWRLSPLAAAISDAVRA